MIYDGDSACYVVAAKFKTVKTALRHFHQDVLTKMFLTRTESAIVHLTSADSLKAGRMNIIGAKPYQANRTGKAKPALLEAVRMAVANPQNWLQEYRVEMHYNLEADDACMMDAYRLKDKGVMVSADKDLRMTPYPYWENSRGEVMPGAGFGSLWPEYTPAGNLKLIGQGLAFFWAQMLMGDQADNIRGLKRYDGRLIGPARTFEVIGKIQDEDEMANFVIDAYRSIDQNPLPEGWLLWMLRWPGDNFNVYLRSLDLSAENRRFLNECSEREWFTVPTGERPVLPRGDGD